MRIKNSQNESTPKRDPSTNPDFDLWVLFDQTRDVIAKSREIELEQYKVTRVQASVLFMLQKQNRGVTLAEISKWILREPHSVSSLINRMEKLGLVKKTRARKDDRILVSITGKGHTLYGQTTKKSIDMIFSSLSQEEKLQLTSYLKKVRAKARNLLGMDYKPPFLP
jgi:DNA-binding MarR family transcriptional regulator